MDDALLALLLVPLELVKGLVPRDRRREAGKRAKAIADGGLAGRAVARTVQDMQAAVAAAVAAGALASAASSGNGSGGS